MSEYEFRQCSEKYITFRYLDHKDPPIPQELLHASPFSGMMGTHMWVYHTHRRSQPFTTSKLYRRKCSGKFLYTGRYFASSGKRALFKT